MVSIIHAVHGQMVAMDMPRPRDLFFEDDRTIEEHRVDTRNLLQNRQRDDDPKRAAEAGLQQSTKDPVSCAAAF
jgi:hypothetical protein